MNTTKILNTVATVKVYYGYGHSGSCIVYGHVLKGKAPARKNYSNNIFLNIIHLVRLFFVRPMPGEKVQLLWGDQQYSNTTETDGFFKFEWKPGVDLAAGWHPVRVNLLDIKDRVLTTGEGKFFVPHSTQYAFVSDIDDTVLISHSATKARRLRVLFTKNPRSRKAFADVVTYYQLLSKAFTEDKVPNPFFYVSSSEWNLYDDLVEFFRHNGLPDGVFLLSQIKKWYQLFKTGKTKHQGKFIRIVRIMETFPIHKFVLLGDNSQSDPEIYVTLANQLPGRIAAIYIRNINIEKESQAKEWMTRIQDKKIITCLFKDNNEAIQHSRANGIIV